MHEYNMENFPTGSTGVGIKKLVDGGNFKESERRD